MQYCRRGVELVVDATRGPRPWRADNSGVVEPRCQSPRQGSRNRDTNAASFRAAAFGSLGSHQPSSWLRLDSAALVEIESIVKNVFGVAESEASQHDELVWRSGQDA